MSLGDQKQYEKISQRLSETVKNQRVSHAYIIEGDEFTGKEEFALDFAQAILCKVNPGTGCDNCKTCRMIKEGTYRDLYRVSADEKSVKDKDIEELQERINTLPMEEGGRNIGIIQDGDTMTVRAQNRLLKSLEEPFPGTVIMLLSENSDSLLPTIRSRCQKIRLYSNGLKEKSEVEPGSMMELAEDLIKMAERKTYFFEIKDKLDSNIKDKKSALTLLDAMERFMRDRLLENVNNGDSPEVSQSKKDYSKEFYSNGIRLVEDARKDLRYNVKERYALGKLLLKIGG